MINILYFPPPPPSVLNAALRAVGVYVSRDCLIQTRSLRPPSYIRNIAELGKQSNIASSFVHVFVEPDVYSGKRRFLISVAMLQGAQSHPHLFISLKVMCYRCHIYRNIEKTPQVHRNKREFILVVSAAPFLQVWVLFYSLIKSS